jgi:hypothetical protein
MVDNLLVAMQLFKENKLGVVRAIPNETSDEQLRHQPVAKKVRNESEQKKLQALVDWARATVKAFMLDPDGLRDDAAVMAAASIHMEWLPSHQSYWNDRFCIAVLCDVDWETQQQAAWCLLANGQNDYWEWRTHCDYHPAEILKRLGIVDANFNAPENYRNYECLDYDLSRKIAEYFELPTCLFDRKKSLTEEEESQRKKFNRAYPSYSAL